MSTYDGGVSGLDLPWDVQGLDLGGEGGDGLEGGVGLEDHHITGAGHVVLWAVVMVACDGDTIAAMWSSARKKRNKEWMKNTKLDEKHPGG